MVLTGRRTVAATFAATAHRHRDRPARIDVTADGRRHRTSWGSLVRCVRHASLALADQGIGPGDAIALDPSASPAERAADVLVAAALGALVGVGGGERLDLERLTTLGAALDDRDPARFEALVAARDDQAVLLVTGGVEHTDASLLVAARSFAQGAGVGADDGLLVALCPGTAADITTAVLVPALTGATAWTSEVDLELLGDGRGLTVVVAREPLPPSPPPRRRRLARRPPPAVQHLLVVGDGGASSVPAAAQGAALSVGAAGGIVTGFGPSGSVGRPLPGVSVAVEDDGGVLVRSCGSPPGAAGVRDDGWLATGLRGRLEGGALLLEPGGPGSNTP